MADYKSTGIGRVLETQEIAPDIFSMWMECEAALSAAPGQFVNIFPKDSGHILARPISICQIDKNRSALRFVYQKKGAGTTEFSKAMVGNTYKILGPLGHGFPTDTDAPILLIGGGMGVAPMLSCAEFFGDRATAVLGYRDEPFMLEEFKTTGARIIISTESGKAGVKGNVLDALSTEDISAMRACVCGPLPMLRAVWSYTKDRCKETFVSMEEHMACGLGACLGCVVSGESGRLCVCKDGPVFNAGEVKL